MNLTNKETIKKLLKKYDTQPLKRFGQNFLINQRVMNQILEAADIKENDFVLEIGAGIGNLTQEIVKRAKRVITVEKDPKMIGILKETLKGFGNVEIIPEDIRKVKSLGFNDRRYNYKIIANLPFYITAFVIRKFLEIKETPTEMILMIQKEVAQRICAKPPDMNLLAVSVQFYAKPKIIEYVSKEFFWPQPKVDSAIIKITVNKERETINSNSFFIIVRAGFSHPRKQILNNLSKELKLDKEKVKSWLFKNNISPERRAETLELNNWVNLTKNFEINF